MQQKSLSLFNLSDGSMGFIIFLRVFEHELIKINAKYKLKI